MCLGSVQGIDVGDRGKGRGSEHALIAPIREITCRGKIGIACVARSVGEIPDRLRNLSFPKEGFERISNIVDDKITSGFCQIFDGQGEVPRGEHPGTKGQFGRGGHVVYQLKHRTPFVGGDAIRIILYYRYGI